VDDSICPAQFASALFGDKLPLVAWLCDRGV